MNLGLEWINDFVHWLTHWLPKCRTVEVTHGGVKVISSFLRRGVRVKTLGPGLFWFWPAVTRVYVTPVVRRPVDLPTQSVDTVDGKPIMFSVSLVYVVTDVEKILTKVEDPIDVIKEIGAAAAARSVASRRWPDLRRDFAEGDVDAELLAATKKALRKYGVGVEDARLTDCVRHVPVRCEGSASGPIPTEMEEE